MNKFLKGDLYIILACLFWGASPTLTTVALNGMSLFNFMGFRFLIGAIILGVFSINRIINTNKITILYSLILSMLLWGAFFLETIGLKFIGPAKSGFLISLDTVLIPILYFLIYKVKVKKNEVIGIMTAFLGIVIFNYTGLSFTINIGVIISLAAASLYAAYTVALGQLVKKCDIRTMVFFQLLFVSLLSFAASVLDENYYKAMSNESLIALVVAGVFCSGLAYFFQASGQRYVSTTRIGMLFCLTPIFGMVISWIVLRDKLQAASAIGALFILVGIISENVNFTRSIGNNKKMLTS